MLSICSGAIPSASVGNGDANAWPRGIAWIDGGVCLEANRGSLRAGVETVGEEIGEDLTELAGGAQDLALGGGIDEKGDAKTCGAVGVEVADFTDDCGRT